MNNLDLYNKVRQVPQEAQKSISGGRLKGMTDINPMWRIKTLTEQFGICGVGWKYEITSKKLEQGANNEVSAFVDVNLYIKVNGEWSEAIPGTGGSMFISSEKNGLYTSDECYKMALTDALSVACKALGFGADIYWNKDSTKYNRVEAPPSQEQAQEVKEATVKAKFMTLFNANPTNDPSQADAEYTKFMQNQQKKGYSLFQINAYLAKHLSDKASNA